MGRRKIEIKPIKDDRNRSVTFLKRKGGLFKKAHELSVLCSVDVAVIIFGSNKKLYEFSSGDINEIIGRHQYYGGAHEHKGPLDFTGKRDGDGSDDEEVDEAALEELRQQPEPPHMLPHMAGYNPMRPAPSASPPVGNGVMGYHPRQHTPQPTISRPDSRNAGMIRRPGSNLGHHPQTQVPNGYTTYLQQQGPYAPPSSQQQPPQQQPPPQQQQQHGPPPPAPPFYTQGPEQPGAHAPVHPQYLDERRLSVPPAYRPAPEAHRSSTPQPSHPQPPQVHPPQQPPQPTSQPDVQPPPSSEQRQDLLQVQQPQPKPLGVKSKSIFTPIDDNRSMLASQWGFSGTDKEVTPVKQDKPGLPDSARATTVDRPGASPRPPQRTITQPHRSQSTASMSGEKRPNLKLQIPVEAEGDGEGTTASPSAIHDSPKTTEAGGAATKEPSASKAGDANLSGSNGGPGVVLPPPSPSASALLSAGTQGPPNPFARPLPPGASTSHQNIETPMSALPSRFVADQFLPSPSSFYPEWGFGTSGGRSAGPDGGNMLPSPLNWQTPVGTNAPGFSEKSAEPEAGAKREREGGDETEAKRVKA